MSDVRAPVASVSGAPTGTPAGIPADAVLLVNLGTPAAATPQAVRSFLREFLSDPRVVELPRWLWLPILHGIVLRTRPAKSAKKYESVWTDEGSPLAVHTLRQTKLLKGLLGRGGIPVAHAMRYGRPSIAEGVASLEAAGARSIIVLPLYPQYSASTAESVLDVLRELARRARTKSKISVVRDFHDHPAFIKALAATVHKGREMYGRGSRLVFSFHGLPQRSIDRGDPYRSQCMTTARLLGAELGLDERDYIVTFQSRFGAAKWITPYTEPTLVELASKGVREVDVVFPGFVSDCLETLEEIGIGVKEAFLAAGGRELHVVPCLNESPAWIAAIAAIARERAVPLENAG